MKTNQVDIAESVASMDLHPRTKRNIRMQYKLAVHTLIPWLQKLHKLPENAAVCEIGCAEGGVLAAFVQRGTSLAVGTDIQGRLLTDISQPVMHKYGLNITFTEHDVIYDEIPDEWKQKFDVVLLRDVIEHLDDPAIALQNIKRIIKPDGVVLITFPPYSSAYGGHQQLLGTKLGAIPFVHLLPNVIFTKIIAGGEVTNQEELHRLHKIRCSAKKVLSAAKKAGYSVVDQRYFGLRPVFRWKYQRPIPIMEVTAIKDLPFVKEIAMECAFVFGVDK